MSISSRLVYVKSEDLLDEDAPLQQAPRLSLSARRQLAGLALAAAGLPLLTLLLNGTTSSLSLEGEVLLYLLAVVVIAIVGGIVVAVAAAIAAALLINYYFVEPLHTLDVAHADQAVALVVFVVVAAVVSGTVEIAARRARAAEKASAQAETLSALAGTDLDEHETLRGVLSQARTTFAMQSVALKVRDHASGDWSDVEQAGWAPPGNEAPVRFDVPISPRPAPGRARAGDVRRGPARAAGVRRRRADRVRGAPPQPSRPAGRERWRRSTGSEPRCWRPSATTCGRRSSAIKASVTSCARPTSTWSDRRAGASCSRRSRTSADRLDAVVGEPARREPPAGRRASASRRGRSSLDEMVGAARARGPRRGEPGHDSTCPRTCRWSRPTPACSSGCSPT